MASRGWPPPPAGVRLRGPGQSRPLPPRNSTESDAAAHPAPRRGCRPGRHTPARAHAWLNGRDYVSPEDVQALIFDVLRHRILVNFKAEAEGITADDVTRTLLDDVPGPTSPLV